MQRTLCVVLLTVLAIPGTYAGELLIFGGPIYTGVNEPGARSRSETLHGRRARLSRAALLERYSDANSSGLLLTPHEVMRSILMRALKAHAQVATHSIGDRGNRLTLDAYEEVFRNDLADAHDVR